MLRIQVQPKPTTQPLSSQIDLRNKASAVIDLTNYLTSLPSTNKGTLTASINAVQAVATVVFASTGPINGQTMTLLNTTITAVTAGPTANQFVRDNSPSVNAANFAAMINASASFANKITATALSGTVTLTAVLAGVLGNGLQAANVNLSNTTVNAFASGAEGNSLTTINLF